MQTLFKNDMMTNEEQIQELRRKLEMRERQLNSLHEINAAFFSQRNLDQILQETLHILLQAVDADAGSLLLYDNEKRKLVFERVIGKTELIGMEIDPEQDREGRAAEVFRTGKSLLTLDTRKECYNRSFDDDTGFQTRSILTVPMRNINGDIIGVLQALNKREGSFTDEDRELLEIVSGQAATSIVNKRLAQEAQLAAVARAVGDLSHDIKNALTPVETAVETLIQTFIEPMFDDVNHISQQWKNGHAELIAEFTNAMTLLREEYPYTQGSVRDGCTDIRELVSEIADYIKGTQATNMEDNDLNEVIRERLSRVEILARQRRVALHIEGLEAVPPFPFDRRLLGRAVYNLVNNALGAINHAVKTGAMEIRPQFNVWVRASVQQEGVFPEGNYCQIEVEDDGAGIPPHVKASLFTSHTISTTPGGTGIGTRFVKDVSDRHGGRVGVESEFGKGAKFWIRLPLTSGQQEGVERR